MVSDLGVAGNRARNPTYGPNKKSTFPQPLQPTTLEFDPGAARVRRRPRRLPPPSLVWVRRDKFRSGCFTASDCFPAGATDRLIKPKVFSFSADFWSKREGRSTYAEVTRKMAGAGSGQGARGGRNNGGRGRNEGIRPPTQVAPTPPTASPVRPPLVQHQQAPPISIYAKPPIFPMASSTQLMYPQMGQMFPGYPPPGYQQYPANPWPQNQQQFQYPFMAPNQCAPIPYPQGVHQPAAVGSGSASGSGQAGQSKSKKKQKSIAGKKPLKTDAGLASTQSALPADEPDSYNVDPKYIGAICYNCGLPGHFVGMCQIPKNCFMCSVPGHHMDACPLWYKPYPAGQFWGSAGNGLGFFSY